MHRQPLCDVHVDLDSNVLDHVHLAFLDTSVYTPKENARPLHWPVRLPSEIVHRSTVLQHMLYETWHGWMPLLSTPIDVIAAWLDGLGLLGVYIPEDTTLTGKRYRPTDSGQRLLMQIQVCILNSLVR